MEMRKERVRHIDGAVAALDQTVMRARTVIPDDQIGADINQVARALSLERRRGCSSAEQSDRQRPRRRRGPGAGGLISGGAGDGSGSDSQRSDEVPAVDRK